VNVRTEQTRSAIAQAALVTFCERGYGVATLEEIGARVGLTRGGVLHHFKSKPDLLQAVAEPYRQAILDLLLNAEVDDPPTHAQRRELLAGFADLMLAHRGTLRLLANDVSARAQLGISGHRPTPHARLVSLLGGSRATDRTALRVNAALGAMIQPVASVWLDLGDTATRDELIDAAMAVVAGLPTTPNAANARETTATAKDRY
jgi:AcrR family transcriptional regulator